MDVLCYATETLSKLYYAHAKKTMYTPGEIIESKLCEARAKLLNQNTMGKYKISSNYKNDLIGLYDEIFVYKIYDFISDNSAPVIVDGGANIGMATLRFKDLYPKSIITCFEPNPKVFALLQKNMLNNNLKDVTLINKAIYYKNTTIDMHIDRDNITDCGSSIDDMGGHRDTMKIEAVKLSDYINGPVDLLKLDIEGAELGVLEDLAETEKLPLVKNIIMEYHPDDLNHRLEKILALLNRNGFVSDVRMPYDLNGNFCSFMYKPNGLCVSMIYATKIENRGKIHRLGSYARSKHVYMFDKHAKN